MAIQYCYEPVEAFYWYPGAIPYTFFYSLGLLCIGFVLRANKASSVKTGVIYFIPAIILAPIIGGGNYSTALVCSIITVLLTIYFFYTNKRINSLFTGIVALLLILTLLISIFAPGNAIRQSTVGEPSAIKGVIVSLIYGAYTIANISTVPVVLVWLLISPFLYLRAKKSEYSFSHPILMLILMFGIYSALGTPCFYALGFAIPERNINLIYFSYYLMMFCILYYFLGWLSRKEIALLDKLIEYTEINFDKFFTCFILLFAFSCVGMCTPYKGENGKLSINTPPQELVPFFHY